MMDDTHIADGIAVKLLLAGLVVASASIGTLALADATPDAATAGVADEAARAPSLLFPIDNVTVTGVGRTPSLLFPIDNVTVTGVAPAAPLAFPIDNATFGGSFTVLTAATDDRYALGQDVDPYALGQDVDHALGQDVDPYALGWDVSTLLLLAETPDAPGQDMDPY
jgi:hypothetical protein